MQSRMDKYYGKQTIDESNDTVRDFDELESSSSLSRSERNQKLYQEVSNKELEEFNINSNASVIGHGNEINIDSIREMLDKKYRELPKNKSMSSMNEPEIGKVNLDETREYDINTVLEKAHQEKEVNYEEDRLKKLRNTQYDILKSLDVVKQAQEEREREEEEREEERELEESKIVKLSKHEEEEKLKELINTITLKESSLEGEDDGELDPLDLLSDLRGDDDNTKVLGALNEEILAQEEKEEKEQDTQGIDVDDTEEKELELKPIEIADEDIETKVNLLLDGKVEKEEPEKLSDTSTDTLNFTQNDFDDFDDLKEDTDVTRVIIRVLIFVIIVTFVIGCIVLLNKLLGLGLF